jgi:hypothetical protein
MTQTALSTAINEAIFSYMLMAIIAALTAVVIRGIVMVLARGGKKAQAAPTPVVVSVTPARDENAAIAAAIGAAVYTVLGAHRLVYLGEAERGFTWTSEIRSRLHTSHTPRR